MSRSDRASEARFGSAPTPPGIPVASTGRRSGAYAQTARVFQLLELLLGRRHPTPLDALAEGLRVSPRQVRRDLEALAELVFAVGRFEAAEHARGRAD